MPLSFFTPFALLGWLALGPLAALAQKTSPADSLATRAKARNHQLLVHPTDSALVLDGDLAEAFWHRADTAGAFFLNFPNDTTYARNPTRVRVAFDQHHLYVAAECFDDDMARPATASSLRRDFEWDMNDNFIVYLNPSGDRLNGFAFAITPNGVEREGQLFNGQEVDAVWDNKWYSAVRRHADRWVAELKIPFKSLRFKHGATQWRANFARNDLKNNQISSWVPVPIAYFVSSAAFTGELLFQAPLPNPGVNISLIPYAAHRLERNYEAGTPVAHFPSAGFDAKVAITPSLTLDLTVNPDFSQVEVDQQVTNLDRFELFFPERRQFFIENNDLFDSFGFNRLKPFFSRRVGIAGRDTVTGLIRQVPIRYGARLSGKLDANWRVGLLNVQTGQRRGQASPTDNYTVGVVQRQVFSRSNIAAIVVNRQRTAGSETDLDRYTRLVGLDYNLQTEDNRWTGKVFYHQAFQPGRPADNFVHGASLAYNVRNVSARWLHEYVGAGYNPNDVGYVARGAHLRANSEVNFTFFAKNSKKLVSHGPNAELNVFSQLNRQVTDRELDVWYRFTLANTSETGAGVYNYYTYFFFPFDPTNTGGAEIPAGSGFTYNGAFLFYQSDRRKLLTYGFEAFGGQYFNGHNFSITPEVNYRFQPFGAIGLRAEYNWLRFPAPYRSTSFWLLAPRLDLTFSRSLFFTTFFQYNQQADNVNIYTRLQWRFRPVSDLFVTYQDNYLPGNFRVKYRELTVKLSYWLNI
jgi:Domain of unknown function (DUF5916)